MNKYLQRYLVAVQYPEVSGFEMLDMLIVRDKLADKFESLNVEEQQWLMQADQQLFHQADKFFAELASVADLAYERKHRKPAPDRWWWFLDVLAAVPMQTQLADLPVATA